MKTLSVALGTLLIISSHAFAKSQIISEFELNLPRQFQEVLINRSWETLMNREFQGNWQIPDQKVETDGIPVHIKNVSLAVRSFMQKPSIQDPNAALFLTAKDLRAELKLGEVSINHTIERSVGGIVGRFRVQALCQNVILNLVPGAGHFSLSINPQFDNSRARLNVQDVHLAWTPGAWVASEIQCLGAEGFNDLIKKEIERVTNDSEILVRPNLQSIKTKIQESLQEVTYDYTSDRELNISRPDIRVFMRDLSFENLGVQGARIKGFFHIHFLLSKNEEVIYLHLGKNTSVANFAAQLRLPKEFIAEFATRAYSADSWLHRVSSTKISGFNSLMRSRFSQFFVWPELMNYSKSSQFLFDISSRKDVSVQGVGLKYELEGVFSTRMWAPRSGAYVPFMNFTTPLRMTLAMSTKQGKLSLQFGQVNLSLASKWDAEYLSRYSPSTRFSNSTIRNRIASSLEGMKTDVSLPTLPVVEGVNLKFDQVLSPTGEDLVIYLK